MSNQTTRRTALAVPVTLPLLPLASYAQPSDDPAVEAYEEWRKAYRAFLVAMKTRESASLTPLQYGRGLISWER